MSLPSGYTQLEYIQSSGTQYINTGFKPNQDTKIVVSVAFLGSAGENVLGSRNSSSDATNRFGIITFGSSSKIGSFFGSTTTQSISLDSSIHNYTLSKAGLSVDGASYGGTYTSSFSCMYPITLFAWNNGSNGIVKNSSKIVDCKIFSGEVLVRNFIPCKNPSGVIGLYDVIENKFYKNAGTGSFVAGAEVKGSHKTLIDGTRYDLKAGRCLVGGTAYSVKKGRVLVNSTGYDIPFSSGIPIGTLPVGSVVKIGVNGKSYDFLVVNQGIPSNSSLYDSSCDGTWLLMKDIYENRVWQSGNINKYESSDIHAYLNSTFLNLFDSNIKDAIKQVKIPYRKNGGSGGTNQSGVNGLSCKVFLLSGYEIGWTSGDNQYFQVDGAKLDYFAASSGGNFKRIANFNGSAARWWLRSPYSSGTKYVWYVDSNGSSSNGSASRSYGIRPAFILPEILELVQNPDGTYSPAA